MSAERTLRLRARRSPRKNSPAMPENRAPAGRVRVTRANRIEERMGREDPVSRSRTNATLAANTSSVNSIVSSPPVHHAVKLRPAARARGASQTRSEEHTSELQSHVNLVCRLLLEKKNR